MLETTCAILPSRDFDETAKFYENLGFRETGRWGDYGYLIIATEKVEIHFFHHKDLNPKQNIAGAYIRSSDVDAFSDMVSKAGLPAKGIPGFGPAEDKDWGMREATLLDPNGNLIRVGQFL